MEIAREQLIKKVAEASGYYQKDVRRVFNTIEDVVLECFDDIDEDNPISVRLLSFLALNGTIWGERERVNPQNREPVICKPSVRILGKVSDGFKAKAQERYDEKKAE
jgi:nucleoid DNA-binding protein